jgi:hypothetical protein
MRCSISLKNLRTAGWLRFACAAIILAIPAAVPAAQTVHHALPAAAMGLQPLNPLAATNRLDLAISLPLRNPRQLDQLLHELYDPASPNFHQWLTPDRFTENFGPTAADYRALAAWAQANGLAVTKEHPNRLILDVRGSVADIARAFHVTMSVYQHPTEKRHFYAPDRQPLIDLNIPVLYVGGLDNFEIPRPLYKQRPFDQAHKLTAAGSGPGGGYMGNDFRSAYAPGVTLNGAGQTVGLFEMDGYFPSDITYYENESGLPNVPLTNVLVGGFSGQPTDPDAVIEVSLDIEMAISMAPGLSRVMVYEAPLTSAGAYDILNQLATDNLAKQISSSWVIDRIVSTPVPNQIYQEYAAQGQSFFQASGDDDAYTPETYQTADNPYITTVGGTTLTTGSKGSYASEIVWQWGDGTGSGGGISTIFSIPAYQQGINMTTNKGSTTRRNVPDVALTADNVYVRADLMDFQDVGGTSCAAPLWAGFTALVNQQAVQNGRPLVGFINPVVYALCQTPAYNSCFHDIVTGDNTSFYSPNLFHACRGYDLCTGWGTPNGQNLINALAIPDSLGVQPNTGFTSIGGSGGPFTITSEGFVLTNFGTNSLTWSLVNTSSWLAVSPPGGTLPPHGSDSTPSVGLGDGAYSLPIGNYTNTIVFSNNTSGITHALQFALQIVPSVPPSILSPPTNLWAVEGSVASFSVAAAGTPPLNYQWQFNSTNIDDATNATLDLANVDFTNAGLYTVTVTNTHGSTNASATLVVGYAPSITTQPQNQETVQTSNATFSVTASGSGTLSYQWSCYGMPLPQGTNSTLILTNIQPTNAGWYTVLVSSPFGSILSSNATLTVDAFPIIQVQPQSQSVLVGTNVTFSVTATGSLPIMPPVTSGTLQLWLRADAGVVTNSAGQVSQWQDQSGNANHAAQANINEQPSLVYPAGIGGEAAIRFNGLQKSSSGNYLFGSGTVNVPTAMTSFTVYNVFNATNNENDLWNIGIPDQYGANRVAMIAEGDLHFSFWYYDYSAPFVVPTNTYRVRIDRVDTNMDTLNMFDATAAATNEYTMPVSGAITPQAGYYIGGLNLSVSGASTGRNACGDIAEWVCYSGYLSEPDRLAILGYLEQKYFQVGANTLTYQWQFDGTNILGATNSTLTLPNVQPTNAGSYCVIISNLIGSTVSSNAALAVGYAPSITLQPQSQEVAQGTNVTFSIGASGTGPLTYQWYLDGAALAQNTNSTLTLTNVQSTNIGSYSVLVDSPFGSILSSNATLTVDSSPIIKGQPQSQSVPVGTNVTLSVTAAGNLPTIPPVTSGTLQLWLKAGTGVVTNSAGQVSQWQDQSGNANHAAQANTTEQPSLVYPGGIGGRAAIRFNGLQNSSSGNYLFGSGTVNVPTAMTSFTVYNVFSATNNENDLWNIGIPNQYGANRVAMIAEGDLHFSFWYFDYSAPFIVPTNTYRVRIDRVDTNMDTLNMFDATAAATNEYTMSVSGATTPQAGYYIGGLNLSVSGAGTGRNACGDIAEWICYSGYLSEPDRLAVLGYLEQKYFQVAVYGTLSYQWQFDGTNIPGATNTTFTLPDVQPTNAGTYCVIISNMAGTTVSSNAVLAVGYAPSISSQPQNQQIIQGSNAMFSVTAAGTGPLSYQWYFQGAAMAQDTNSTLTLTNVQSTNIGSYSVLVGSPFGSILSSSATLTIDAFPTITAQPQSQDVIVGSNATFSVAAVSTAPAMPTMPLVKSGTLQLWLKANTGVVTNSAGLVSQWQDQSTNANHAAQTNANEQPSLVYPAGIGGNAAIRFNGLQNSSSGNYLFGSGTVKVPSAMTSFTVYNVFSATNNENDLWNIGIPNQHGANRVAMIAEGDLHFSFWSYDYSAPFVVPTNTYRVRIDRVDTNADTLNMFDATAAATNEYTMSVSGASTPQAGYYIGGLNLSVPGASPGRNAWCDVAEWVCYSGYLSESDRLAVLGYLEQKYFQLVVSGNLSYQWQFDGTNIPGATNSTLTLPNVQPTNAGSYCVIISNLVGVATSSNAVLAVGYAPSISSQPQNQQVVQGSNAVLSVTAAGTGPFSYQWYFQGAALAQDTNSTLTLTNIQSINVGSYTVLVSSPFGSILSSNATLAVDPSPVILTQPQGQNVIVGSNATFSVAAVAATPTIPPVTSGTLQLWLRADAGVVTNSAGLVSQWQDQSANANHAAQTNANEQPSLVYPAGIGGEAAIRFNGLQNSSSGNYLFGSGTVNVPTAMTSFTVYNVFSATNNENDLWNIGIPNQYGANRVAMIAEGDLHFSFWYFDYSAPFVVPTNTYRVRIDRVDTNMDTLNMFDATAAATNEYTMSVSGGTTPQPGYYIGGLNLSVPGASPGRDAWCDVAEWVCYSGYLSEPDRLAVLGYLEQKYFQVGVSTLTYQWQFDGTNILGATNASLSLNDVQPSQAGAYTVIVTYGIASVTSSNAMLNIGGLPVVTERPASQSVETNCSATFNVAASSDLPLSYQWLQNDLPLAVQTNTTLFIPSAQSSNFGNYSVIVSNAFGAVTSSVAVLALASPPVANPDIVLRFAGCGLRINVADLTSNDTAAEYDVPTVISVSSNSTVGGTVTLDYPWIYYLPASNQVIIDSFSYTISDGHCGTASSWVIVQVKADNPQPLHFGIAGMANGSFQLTSDVLPGCTYQIQYTDNFSPPNWQPLTSSTADAYGVLQFMDNSQTNAPSRFYRIICP